MKKASKTETRKRIEEFFKRERLEKESVRKVKRLAMQSSIRLGKYRSLFCKKCYADLKGGKIRITKTHKLIFCPECATENKVRIKTS